MDLDWPTYRSSYTEDGVDQTMSIPMTFADFAITEARFRKHFRMAPPDTWNDSMVPLAEFLETRRRRSRGLVPVRVVDRQEAASERDWSLRIRWSKSCEDRLVTSGHAQSARRGDRQGAGLRDRIAWCVKRSRANSQADSCSSPRAEAAGTSRRFTATVAAPSGDAPTEGGGDGYMAPWIDTAQCTSATSAST